MTSSVAGLPPTEHLHKYLAEISQAFPERPDDIKPDIEEAEKYDDPEERERLDLERGAVMKAVIDEGEGEETPEDGDLIFMHYACRLQNQTVVASSLPEHGGDGSPIAFICAKGGRRVPRSWELCAAQMKKGELALVKSAPEYAYDHPLCDLSRPPGVSASEPLEFQLRLLAFYPGKDCSAIALEKGAKGGDIFKLAVESSDSWETPRSPFDVEIHCTARMPPLTGVLGEGKVLFSTPEESPLTITIGEGQVGPHLEAALCSMSQGEKAVFFCPADANESELLWNVPSVQNETLWVEYEIALQRIVQVRDMTGGGEVIKRRTKEGEGDFPIDCPLEDCQVRIHYTVSQEGKQVYSSREDGSGDPVEFTLGDGMYPAGVEMSVRLMTVKEVSHVSAVPEFAYLTPGIDEKAVVPNVEPSLPVVWVIELISFDQAPNWHQMTAGERITVVERMKASANHLFSAQRYSHAKTRYEKAYKVINHTFDSDGKEEEMSLHNLKAALELNIAAVLHKQEDYSGAITWCNKILTENPEHPKALYRRANAQLAMGNYDEAEADFREYAEHAPEDATHAETMISRTVKKRDATERQHRSRMRGFMN
mmetsp:Transcript_33042/g.93524  ORF Transcript_33042/g.93524 Transcript_33042/m.93524 type:complete len:596 (-) Transcript_33042:206-1993(-)|eukprot:CAMPEP_0117672078 /NCGR_PEP_ID=MMETSP0804-20121206/13699_1 /TAXON_ID=1074897 /ORGANISM="Tetraselmis astigmatica, Strain CCMP880" /LENGTH=595 /DNA_ID=CAMNT_0005480629 /DNA_START=302 /DNA_END=2089 /DNA_ORIENTATION=+